MGDSVDYQVLFNLAVAIGGFLGGWVLNNISRSIDRLDIDVRAMPANYVSKEDYRNDIREVKEALVRIETKLADKADKR